MAEAQHQRRRLRIVRESDGHQRQEPHPLDVDLTRGERIAERVTDFMGSWPYIIGQAVFLATWFLINVLPFVFHWDPWPWMGANIIMSTIAAFATSFVLIAQKVSGRRDHKLWDLMMEMLSHVERVAQADHVEHGRLLRELHSHTVCAGHTTIESEPGTGMDGQ